MIGKNGVMIKPNVTMITAIQRYTVRYSFNSAHTVGVSFSASGLYILYTIAAPIPSSVRDMISRIETNKLSSPR